jgi:hypothetical protein
MILEELVSRGHKLQDLLTGYPVEALQNFYRATQENRRRALMDTTAAQVVAVSHALDLLFSGGKGKILDGFMQTLQDTSSAPKPAAENPDVMTERAMAWFMGQPKRKKDAD